MNESPESNRAPGKTETRASPRYRVQINAEIAVTNHTFPVLVQSISASGAFARVSQAIAAVGAAVEFVIPNKRNGKPALRIPATVVRLEKEGMALRFGRYDSSVYTDLIDMIY